MKYHGIKNESGERKDRKATDKYFAKVTICYLNFHYGILVHSSCLEISEVRNIWFLSPVFLSKREKLALLVCILFEESVFIIQKLKNKHTFLKNYTNCAKLRKLSFDQFVYFLRKERLFFNFWMIKYWHSSFNAVPLYRMRFFLGQKPR